MNTSPSPSQGQSSTRGVQQENTSYVQVTIEGEGAGRTYKLTTTDKKVGGSSIHKINKFFSNHIQCNSKKELGSDEMQSLFCVNKQVRGKLDKMEDSPVKKTFHRFFAAVGKAVGIETKYAGLKTFDKLWKTNTWNTEACAYATKNMASASFGIIAITATYNDKKGSLNCDYAACDKEFGFGVVFDGAGHGSAELQKMERPLYEGFVEAFKGIVSGFKLENIDSMLHEFQKKSEEEIKNTGSKLKSLNEIKLKESGEFKQKINGIRDKMVTAVLEGKESELNAGDLNLMKEKLRFDDLENMLNGSDNKYDEEIKKELQNILKEIKRTDISDEEVLKNINEIIGKIKNRSNKLIEGLSEVENKKKYISDQFGFIANETFYHSPPKSACPGMALAQIIHTPDGKHHLFTAQSSDCCFLIAKPKDKNKEIDFSDKSTYSVEVIAENPNNMGLGEDTEAELSYRIEVQEVPKGSICLLFSDGIGEFLTQEEVEEGLKEAQMDKFTSLGSKLAEKIKKIGDETRKGDDKVKKRDGKIAVAKDPKAKVDRQAPKVWNEANQELHDDLSLVLLRV